MKRLLEGSMRFRLPYDAYQHQPRVQLKMITGQVQHYDLKGDHLDETFQDKVPIYVESKNVKDASGQGSAFKKFLAQAYSATVWHLDEMGSDPEYEFMWASTCPWIGTGFREVATVESVQAAVEEHVGSEIIPEDHQVRADLVRTVAERIWVWIIADRHEAMLPSAEMRSIVVAKMGVNAE